MIKPTRPYGTWSSPVTPEVVLKSGASVDELIVDPVTSAIYHTERRPAEGGRVVIVDTENGLDVVGKEWNVRTAVHEMGGAPAIAHAGIIYFSNLHDGRVYRLKGGDQPDPVTPENDNYRFAKFAVHPKETHLLAAILEDHTKPLPSEVVNTLVVINTKDKTLSTLASGADFYSHPCFTPDGRHIAWQQWYHPDMSWEAAEIWIANVSMAGHTVQISDAHSVAGKRDEVSAVYPSWASNDLLLFVSDESGYYNPWTYSVSSGRASAVLSEPVDEDFAEPEWHLGYSFGTPLDHEGKMALYTALKNGRNVLYLVSLQGGTLEQLDNPYKDDDAARTVVCNIKEYAKPKFTAIGPKQHSELPFSREYVSVPRPITVKLAESGQPVHVLFYPPTNPDFDAPEGERPPAIFWVHGGPTTRTGQGLNLRRQLYTTRGWAWVDVNYGGSSGFGRKYIKRLEGRWGIVDVQDCVTSVQQLAAPPYSLIDPQRSAISGASAGGYTVLKSLCTFPDAFAAGTSSYGISDFFKLAEFTHKFESHTLFKLVGGTPDEIPEVYKERSPVFLADKIKVPLLVLQGSVDAIVPPDQAEAIVETMKKQGGRVEYVIFEGEGHGWRQEKNMRIALEKEIAFYEDVFGLKK